MLATFRPLPALTALFLLSLHAVELQAFSAGVSEASMEGNDCRQCHGGGNLPSTIAILGDSSVGLGETLNLSVVIGTTMRGGFNLSASGGGLASGTNSQLLDGELTHRSPTPAVGDSVSWNFSWTAPSQESVQTLSVCGQPVNSDGQVSGDGPARCTTKSITVQNDVLDPAGDEDGDGMSNGFEEQNGFSPRNSLDAAGDADDDGLTNLAEFQRGTEPRERDTDLDGLPDGFEVERNFDPLTSTSDRATLFGDGAVTLNVLADKGEGFSLLSVTTPTNGGVVISAGLPVYTPGSGFVGGDEFSYSAERDDGTRIDVRVLLTVEAASLTQVINVNLGRDPAFSAQFVADLAAEVADNPEGETAALIQQAIQELAAEDLAFQQRFTAQLRAALATEPFELFVFIGDDNLQGRTESGDFNSAAASFEAGWSNLAGAATLVLNCAQAGSSIAQWYDLRAPRDLFVPWLSVPGGLDLSNSCMEAIDGILTAAPPGSRLRGMVIGLGASDAEFAAGPTAFRPAAPEELAERWGTMLSQTIDHYRAAYGAAFDLVLLRLPAISIANTDLASRWQEIIAAQEAHLSLRSQLIGTDAIDTWNTVFLPLFSDVGQEQLAAELVSAFAEKPPTPLGTTGNCSAATPCFPETDFLIDAQRCQRFDLIRDNDAQSLLCDQHGNSLHALQASCGGCLELESLADGLGLGIVTTRIGESFGATFFNRQTVGGESLEPLTYDSPFTANEPRGCGFQDRESSTLVLAPGDYDYRLEALLSERCNAEDQSACDILSDPAVAEQDSARQTITVAAGACTDVVTD